MLLSISAGCSKFILIKDSEFGEVYYDPRFKAKGFVSAIINVYLAHNKDIISAIKEYINLAIDKGWWVISSRFISARINEAFSYGRHYGIYNDYERTDPSTCDKLKQIVKCIHRYIRRLDKFDPRFTPERNNNDRRH